jgi:hypothetical protein
MRPSPERVTQKACAAPSGLDLPFPLLHGPLLYLYTEAVTNQVAPKRFRILHFVPFFLVYLLFLSFIMSPAEHKIFVYQNNGLG